MPDDAAAVEVLPLLVRVRAGLRRSANWLQFIRFAIVGAAGYVVNLAVFAFAVHVAGLDYRLAAVVAFLVAVTHNFAWNRSWTFAARGGRAAFQAPRFLLVSVGAFLVSLGALTTLVAAIGMPELPAQAVAIVVATPFGFLGNKLWSFER